VLRGTNHSDTFWEPGGFEIAENDPLEIEELEGPELTDDECAFVVDWLLDHGDFVLWDGEM
jgi:hypothetical protein